MKDAIVGNSTFEANVKYGGMFFQQNKFCIKQFSTKVAALERGNAAVFERQL